MSNGVPNPQAPASVQIVQMILQFLTLVLTLYIAKVGNNNQDKIEQVGMKQEQAADKAEDVKKVMEAKADKEHQATAIQLWSTWKYLQSIADESQLPSDRTKALEAKKAYDEFVKKRS